jgi:hypothetical protein
MPDPEERNDSDTAERPTRLQRAARRGCAGIAYAAVLVPLAFTIILLSIMTHGWELAGGFVMDILFGENPGAHTQITVFNESGHDVQISLIRFDQHHDQFSGVLEAKRKDDPDQSVRRYQTIYFRDIVPRRFPVEIRYTELDTEVERHASFTADRSPRGRCSFWIVLSPDGPELSSCLRSEVEDFGSP